METLSITPRASELVREYIEKEFLASSEMAGSRLPAVELIADHLQVSVSTVRSVVRKMASDGLLETQAGLGTFVKKGGKAEQHPLLLATNMIVFNTSHAPNWSESIYIAVMRAASGIRRGISVMPVAPHLPDEEELVRDELLSKLDYVDMVMLFGAPNRAIVRAAYEAAGKPVVDINPESLSTTANFVSTDFYAAACKIGQAWHATGRRRILFISAGSARTPSSAELSLAGLAKGVGRDSDPSVEFDVVFTADIGEEDGEQAVVEAIQNRGFTPDAVFCFGDLLGVGALRALEAAGLSVPEQVSLVAGTGLPSTQMLYPHLTLMVQPLSQIGEAAVQMLYKRYENGCISLPGQYLTATFSKGTTTRPEENALL